MRAQPGRLLHISRLNRFREAVGDQVPVDLVETYLWVGGDPFNLHDTHLATASLDQEQPPDTRFEELALEMIDDLSRVTRGVGYVAAGKRLLVIGSPVKLSHSTMLRALDYLSPKPAHSQISIVPDKRGNIARTASLAERVAKVRGAVGEAACRDLPKVVLQVPPVYERIEERHARERESGRLAVNVAIGRVLPVQ